MASTGVSPRASGAATPVHHSPFDAAVAARERASSRGGASPRTRDDRLGPIPEAKRPLDAASIQVSVQGVRLMSAEDLSSAFFAINGRMERSEGHGANLFEVTDHNAELLTEVCKDLAALRAAQAATSEQVGTMVLKITSDTREAVDGLQKRDAERDETLRGELNAMAQTLEKGHGIMEAKSDALRVNIDEDLALMFQAATEPSAPPGLINQQVQYLQTAVEGIASRLQSAESNEETFEAAIKDAQA